MSDDIFKKMHLSELVDIFCQQPRNFMWFLGAGASRSSGLPTAMDIIWDLKKRYYCREENQDIDLQDIQLDAVKSKIQNYMDSKGFPSEGDSEEYTTYFEKTFGENRERQRKYLATKLKEDDVRLSVGNRIFATLLSSNYCRIAFTTNFDSVVEKAFADVSGKSIAAFHLEGKTAAKNALNNEEYPIYCKIHGDFRHDSIKNLASDLVTQNRELSSCMINAGNRFGVVVAGYSGRDKSVMDIFYETLKTPNPFPHGLFWTGMKGATVSPNVKNLLNQAEEKGVNAKYVEIETFDAFMLRLWRNIPNKSTEADKKIRRKEVAYTSIALPNPGTDAPLIRMNALPITKWTTKCSKLIFKKNKEWSDLKKAQRSSKGNLILTKGKSIWCWGKEANVREVFSDDLSDIKPDESEFFSVLPENLHFRTFFLTGLCKALAKEKPLLAWSNRNSAYLSAYLIVNANSNDFSQMGALSKTTKELYGKIPNLFTEITEKFLEQKQVEWAEAVRVSIDLKDGRLWLLLDPDVWIWPPRARSLARAFLDERKRGRTNAIYNSLLDGWVHAVFGTGEQNVEIFVSPFESSLETENPTFTIMSRTGFSRKLSS